MHTRASHQSGHKLNHMRFFHYLQQYTSIANSHEINNTTSPRTILKLNCMNLMEHEIMIYGISDKIFTRIESVAKSHLKGSQK